MNEESVFSEAGVFYYFPPSNKPEVPCTVGMREYRYERYKNGKSLGVIRVFVMGQTDENFLKLLENWNRKGISGCYHYVRA
jgi:hypothetical protein